jgi:hypothetical protein
VNIEQVNAHSDGHDDMTSDMPQRVRLPWDDEKITISPGTFPKATGIRNDISGKCLSFYACEIF